MNAVIKPGEATSPGRILYFDYLEAMAIFLVLSTHGVFLKGNLPASIAMSITPAAVPIFFMVHGALLLSRSASPQKQIHRFMRVLFQLIAWNTIYLILSLLTGMISSKELTPEFFYHYYLLAQDSGGFSSGHLWFIYALLSVYLAYPLLTACKQSGKKYLQYIAVLSFCMVFPVRELTVYGTWIGEKYFGAAISPETLASRLNPLGTYCNCLFFFVYGYLLSLWIAESSKKGQGRRKAVASSLGLSLLGILLLMLERKVSTGQFSYNWNPLPGQYQRFGTFLLATGIFLFFGLLPLHKNRFYPVVKTISIHTLDIYYIHSIISNYIRYHYYSDSGRGVLINALRAAIILILSWCIGQIIRKIPLIRRLLT